MVNQWKASIETRIAEPEQEGALPGNEQTYLCGY